MNQNLFSLDGKVALITGASRGIGQAMAVGLAAAGADIVGLDRTPRNDTRTQVETLGRRYHHIACDLIEATPDRLAECVAEVVETYGRLDILLNNAGTIRRGPVLEFTAKDWHDVLQVNLSAAFFLAQAAARHMVTQGSGKIINIVSMLSFQGGILVPSYTAAKSGLAGLTKALANELAPHNINVNAIAPGYIATNNTAPLRADQVRNKAILDRIPAGRWGEPEDLQGAAVFLASAASDYMHGTLLAVDGGWLAR
jgi:2-deoxy-D-gluconate 3-dehydrogenase